MGSLKLTREDAIELELAIDICFLLLDVGRSVDPGTTIGSHSDYYCSGIAMGIKRKGKCAASLEELVDSWMSWSL